MQGPGFVFAYSGTSLLGPWQAQELRYTENWQRVETREKGPALGITVSVIIPRSVS